MIAARITGTWRLCAYEVHSSDGRRSAPLGERPIGFLMYDGQGHMSGHLLRRERPRFVSDDLTGGSPDEVAQAFRGAVCYFGAYEVDEAQALVLHRVEGSLFPNWIGQVLPRKVSFRGEHLVLSSPPVLFDGAELHAHLELERVSPC